MTSARLQEIKARCEAATTLSNPCKHPGCHNHLTHPCEGCGRQGGFASWETLLSITRQDLPDCLAYIERLEKAVEASKQCSALVPDECDREIDCDKCEAWKYPCEVREALEAE